MPVSSMIQAMKNGSGATKMRSAMRILAKIIVAGLEYSARTTALHEGLPWMATRGGCARTAAVSHNESLSTSRVGIRTLRRYDRRRLRR